MVCACPWWKWKQYPEHIMKYHLKLFYFSLIKWAAQKQSTSLESYFNNKMLASSHKSFLIILTLGLHKMKEILTSGCLSLSNHDNIIFTFKYVILESITCTDSDTEAITVCQHSRETKMTKLSVYIRWLVRQSPTLHPFLHLFSFIIIIVIIIINLCFHWIFFSLMGQVLVITTEAQLTTDILFSEYVHRILTPVCVHTLS